MPLARTDDMCRLHERLDTSRTVPIEPIWYPNPLTRTLSLPDGCIVLELQSGRFQSLNATGGAIWQIIQSNPDGISATGITEQLTSDRSNRMDPEMSVESFVAALSGKHLISERSSGPVIASAAHIACSDQPARPPAGPDLASERWLSPGLPLKARAYLALLRCGRALHGRGFFALRCHVVGTKIRKRDRTVATAASIARCSEAITWATLHYPRAARCLQSSAALTVILRKHGVPAAVVIGCEALPFYSHAWVEVNSIVINDSQTVQKRFAAIDRWEWAL